MSVDSWGVVELLEPQPIEFEAVVPLASHLLTQRVCDSLKSKWFGQLECLNVVASQGVVTIAGTVESFYAKQVLMSICRATEGVTRLIDQLQVSERSTGSDDFF